MLGHSAAPHSICETGPGDDAAVLVDGSVITTDSMVEGIHWNDRLQPSDVGWKVIAVSVSDLAAMGATPLWATCSLSLPNTIEPEWIRGYAEGLQEACETFGVTLIGGDTTGSPKTRFVNVTMGGKLVNGAIRRCDAKETDELWVTGLPGLAASGYALQTPSPDALNALRRPIPPLQFALDLAKQELVHGMMDLSDGLASDLPKLCEAAGVGAMVYPKHMPSHPDLEASPLKDALRFAGGDDFQLLFTAPEHARRAIQKLADHHQITVSRIGKTTSNREVRLADRNWPDPPWSHFNPSDPFN